MGGTYFPYSAPGRARLPLALCAALVLLTLAGYWPVKSHPFIPLDDNLYVYENGRVLRGLTVEGARWAFGTTSAQNWHPLTWLSHMTDVELLGADPGRHHVVNVLFHAANACLVFLLLLRLTGAVWRSALVAALFALHPLRVESVAWVSERKDVLSAFLGLLFLHAYVRYARRPGAMAYLVLPVLLALGLMAKPMLVTLPFLLLLLDWWPLGRTGRKQLAGTGAAGAPAASPAPLSRLLLEKAPLFALSAASCAVTYYAQQEGGAVAAIPLGTRLVNGIAASGTYLWKTAWPASLSFFYPYRVTGLPVLEVAAAGAAVAAITALAVRHGRGRPFLPVGWFWFLGMLVPVIGIVQVGAQAMADRYTYLPHVGLFLAAVWGSADLLQGVRRRVPASAVAVALLCGVLLVLTRMQLGYWKDAATLFDHASEVTERNYLAENNIGVALEERGRLAEAESHYLAAIAYQPYYAEAHNNLGIVAARQGRLDEAMGHFRDALRLRPEVPDPHNNLGLALAQAGKVGDAIPCFREAVRLAPEHVKARVNLAAALSLAGDPAGAAANLREALRVDPGNEEARRLLRGIPGGGRD